MSEKQPSMTDDAPVVPITTTVRGVPVIESSDAGAYFCEHVYYAALAWNSCHKGVVASAPGGEPLIGFLHVPGHWDRPGDPNRHACTLSLLERAVSHGACVVPNPSTILITGFGPFLDVEDNPTGHLVNQAEQIQTLARPGLRIERGLLPVNAGAINGGPESIQAHLDRIEPQLVILMGVARSAKHYRVETRATNRRYAERGGCHPAEIESFDALHGLSFLLT